MSKKSNDHEEAEPALSEGQLPLDLVPAFASHDEEPWSPLTKSNPDYERLWSAANGDGESHPVQGQEPPSESSAPTVEESTTEEEVDPAADSEPEVDEPPPPALAGPQPPTPGFTGTLVTGSAVLNSSVVVGKDRIILWGGGAELGNWDHEHCQIVRLTFSRFAIKAENETLTFTADDPTGLENAISTMTATPPEDAAETAEEESVAAGAAASTAVVASNPTESAPAAVTEATAMEATVTEAPVRRPRIKSFRPESSDAPPTSVAASVAVPPTPEEPVGEEAPSEEITIADTVRAHSDTKTVKARRFTRSDFKGLTIKASVVVVLIAILAGAAYAVLLLMGRVESPGAVATTVPTPTSPPITIVITTAPPATVSTTTAPPVDTTTIFQTDPGTLTERWNALAEVSAPNMVLFSDLQSPFILLLTPNVTLEGVLDPVVGNATMRATPTGTPEGDGAILSALGILLGTADPSLTGADRKALLFQLGLDVDRPELGGINGSLTFNGLSYRMVYNAEQNTLELVITPEAAAAPATTAAS